MKTKLIKTEADYQAALERIEAIFVAKPGTPEGDELELLSTLVELYEEQTFPIGLPSPVDAIKFRMEQAGLKAKDMIPYIGSAPKVSEVPAHPSQKQPAPKSPLPPLAWRGSFSADTAKPLLP